MSSHAADSAIYEQRQCSVSEWSFSRFACRISTAVCRPVECNCSPNFRGEGRSFGRRSDALRWRWRGMERSGGAKWEGQGWLALLLCFCCLSRLRVAVTWPARAKLRNEVK
ncbi:hypothetical protein K431DRAFT_99994 [Polychaeton citri CBS 116435]|uniref:Uncharacterized protein n=1 Tax=Polychaeton citri CBS 116435 TaxID=1314669 RepID=A0A9P4QGR6_9PEZI|nr:hypothetical protein K431DRAFT_99994 [Polychaeton citri CBS 116435]